MARSIVGLACALALAPISIAAPQFQMPLPPHASPDLAFQIYSPVCDSVRHDLGGIRAELKSKPRFTVRVPGASDTLPVSVESCSTWSSVAGKKVLGSEAAIHRIFGGTGVNLLSDAASTFKSDQIFVQTSIVAGGIGPVYFKASYGQLFSSEESDDPSVTREELQDRASSVLRLIQNGGSAAARVIAPIVWGGGAVSQQAVGAYFNAGVVGPLSETDSLRATIGGRYTSDKKDYGLDAVSSKIVKSAKDSWNAFTPRFVLDYAPSEKGLVYVSVSRGFKSGGFNTLGDVNQPVNFFNPEYVWNYEVGTKATLFDKRLRFGLTAFYADYTNLQASIFRINEATGVRFPKVENSPKAKIKGVEFEFEAAPVQGLRFTGSATRLDATYGKF